MGTITPMLDTLLPQVLGRSGNVERFSATRASSPLRAIAPIAGGEDAARRNDALLRSSVADQFPSAAKQGRAAAPSAHNPPATATVTPRNTAPPAADIASSYRHISRAGQSLSALFDRFPVAPKSRPAHNAALLPGPTLPSALALTLADQVSHSGVFYESHLRQWLEGTRSLTRMRAESARRTGAHDVSATGADKSEHPRPLDERLMPVLRQQLDVLQYGIFRWQADIWPGVPMDWQIEGPPADDRQTPAHDAASEPGHRTSLRLDMPRLGTIEVQLTLKAGAVDVHAWAADRAGARMLDADAQTLRSRLTEYGFETATVTILGETDAP